MAARPIADLAISFGLVNIPVKIFSATDASGGAVRFNLLTKEGHRVKQQYIDEATGEVVPRAEMVKGYEFEKGQFVLFTPDELKALEEGGSHLIEIVSFIPVASVDPTYYDKAYLLAPDKRGGKPYSLLQKALLESGQCALAKWAWKSKQYVVQIRATEEGLVLQQLLYASEVRSFKELNITPEAVSKPELQLALQLINQGVAETYDPAAFKDEERERVLAAIDEKISGGKVVAARHPEDEAAGGGQVIDLVAALQASLGKPRTAAARTGKPAAPEKPSNVTVMAEAKQRKPVKRATKAAEPAAAPAPASRARAKK
ncbi:MAG: Ku protein [Burkholderiales bacterium]|nr:Ku protein [Burkholderiales bacterium]